MSIKEKGFQALIAEDYSGAVTLFTQALEKKKNALLLCNRALAYSKLGMYRKSIRDCVSALALDSKCLRAVLTKARCLVEMKKVAQARKVLKLGVEAGASYGDAQLFFEMQELLEALKVARAAPKEKDKAKDTLQKAQTVAEQGMVAFGSGNADIDQQVALGYLRVNQGRHDEAVRHFDALLRKYPDVLGAYLGRGTALALSGHIQRADDDFTRALKVDPKCVDALKRRGQSRGALGKVEDAVDDYTRAIELSGGADGDAFTQRGMMYYKLKHYRRGTKDLRLATLLQPRSYMAWNQLGMSLNQLGDSDESIAAHERAAQLAPANPEVWCNLAQAHKDRGNYKQAEQYFSRALSLDPNHASSVQLRGMLNFSSGRHAEAIRDFSARASLPVAPGTSIQEVIHLLGVSYQGLGQFTSAISVFDVILKQDPTHVCWYNKQLAIMVSSKIDTKMSDWNLDSMMDAQFKESWCKRLDHAELRAARKPKKGVIAEVGNFPQKSKAKRLLSVSSTLAEHMHLNCLGFLRNTRQLAMGGLGALEMAQALVRSKWCITWRETLNIAIRWRQLSEPNDPVWWVDQLSPAQFAEGFGSHTPLITGQCRVIRYGPQFPRALAVLKESIMMQKNIPELMRKELPHANTCQDLYAIVRRDFWVTTPCYSTCRPGHIMEGTRLTLQRAVPEGYEFSIRTPGTPPRWEDFEIELTAAWANLSAVATRDEPQLDDIVAAVLRFAFFYYNMMPLSRGTAASAWMTVQACLLACGYELTGDMPKGIQPDWTAILSARVEDYIEEVSHWLTPMLRSSDILQQAPQVDSLVVTARNVIQILNLVH